MKLTAKGRYAVTAMVDLAVYGGEGPISLGEISERQSISQPYLEQLFAKLKANHLVLSVRGPGGGYRLGRDSQDIDVADIVASVDESVDATRCGGKADCQGGEMVGFKRSDSRFFKRGEFGESRPKESCARDCDQAIDGSTRPDRNPSRTTSGLMRLRK